MRFAAEHGMPIGVQAAGHGARIPADGALLIDTSALREIEVDPATNRARIGAGARLLDVVMAAEHHGLAMPAGYARTVGAVGYTLGGGHGWFARQQGLAAQSVRSIDLVTPAGDHLHLTPEIDPDLWWGMLGHGAALATVTRERGYPGDGGGQMSRNQRLIAGGFACQDDEPNSIIYSAPDEREENAVWLARGMVDAGSNTLYAWANCLVA